MSDHPKISIISTVYNTGPYLRPAVESILAQTFTDFELLLVDDKCSRFVCDVVRNQFYFAEITAILVDNCLQSSCRGGTSGVLLL